MSETYLRALCAANGYSVGKTNHDNDGVDIEVECCGRVADDSIKDLQRIYTTSIAIYSVRWCMEKG